MVTDDFTQLQIWEEAIRVTISKASVDWLSAYKIGAWQYYASLKPPLMGGRTEAPALFIYSH